ncbi:MAG: 50S ribosomal protein L15 [Lachnospiraceae bacterium]|jgi:large subunit ribosomal protein L15|nr:50S ribosomal protein L15 [Lachnospiraceae bacterium]MCI1399105.1 50S ribosomal protein L15 [Lachnospiraceae bacterium]MCI1423676.1 50S ribosomal protein L15 [Lachnospiraceae bacterium]MCI1452465.1 50S ribosomal protein L15 [Lachnospiraceae bacterium]MDD5847721.1 50S ribosomal protein L15 [Bacillota bacterium]
MELNSLRPADGSRHSDFRKGRGTGSGNGKTAGFGHKGQKARSGRPRAGFEGGQMPLYRRLPKRGFTNYNSKDIVTVSLATIADKFEDGATVDVKALLDAGIIKETGDGVKVLSGDKGKEKLSLTKKLTIKANAFSAAAKEKIEAAGGAAEIVD